MSVQHSPIADLEHPFALVGFPTSLSIGVIDKDIEKRKMQKDVPNRRSANAER